jgi:hypothetical protein
MLGSGMVAKVVFEVFKVVKIGYWHWLWLQLWSIGADA